MEQLLAGIETGGTKILAGMTDLNGKVVADRRWATGTPVTALQDLIDFLLSKIGGAELAAMGIASFRPLVTDPTSPDYGLMLTSTKAGWSGSNLRADLAARFDVPVMVDSDVNAAAVAEQAMGAAKACRA